MSRKTSASPVTQPFNDNLLTYVGPFAKRLSYLCIILWAVLVAVQRPPPQDFGGTRWRDPAGGIHRPICRHELVRNFHHDGVEQT